MNAPVQNPVQKEVKFIQFDIPPLKVGEYTITATQTVNQTPPNNKFTLAKTFAVPGDRFQLSSDDIVGVFPQNLANGEFDGVLPQVVLARQTLPWQRTAVEAEVDAPWLAVLLLQADELPPPCPATLTNPIPVCAAKAADLIPAGTAITVWGSTATGTGTMPVGTISYPNINPLDYGQTPDDPCNIIDLPLATFNRVAPSAADLPYLAHVRQTDTLDSEDNPSNEVKRAIVLGNRLPRNNADAYAFLVSLENMGDLLPNDDGSQSSNIPAGTTTVRLTVFRSWRFFVNTLDETFQTLLEHLNKDTSDQLGLTSLRLPAPVPDPTAVATALQHQAAGALVDADADVLVANALTLGYAPLNHHLREAGKTVSWYRGPCVPYAVPTTLTVPASGPDALLRYDPQTGMFDASYAAAWQLGQLVALQSQSFSTTLYSWKKTLQKGVAAQEEQALIEQKLGPDVLPSLMRKRTLALQDLPDIPKQVVDLIGRLKLLKGVPFAYLVPDQAMLPVESLRFFQIDFNWIEAVIDGAFSIGRASVDDMKQDAAHLAKARPHTAASARTQRRNDRPHLATLKTAALGTDLGPVTGFLLRSQVVSGWPRLNVNGYSDTAGQNEIPKLRLARLSKDVLLGLFEGTLQMLAIHEAPEQLHCGVEGSAGSFTTTLRDVTGTTPGQQFIGATAGVLTRSDNQTVQAADTAASILTALNGAPYNQGIPQQNFTAAEFALEMIKGVIKVEYLVK